MAEGAVAVEEGVAVGVAGGAVAAPESSSSSLPASEAATASAA